MKRHRGGAARGEIRDAESARRRQPGPIVLATFFLRSPSIMIAAVFAFPGEREWRAGSLLRARRLGFAGAH